MLRVMWIAIAELFQNFGLFEPILITLFKNLESNQLLELVVKAFKHLSVGPPSQFFRDLVSICNVLSD